MPKTERVPDAVREQVLQYKKVNPLAGSRAIGEFFVLHHKTVNRILKQSGWTKFKEVDVSPELGQGIVDDIARDTSAPEATEESVGTWVQGEKYVFNGETDTYVTFLKCRPTPLVLSGTKFRAMKKAYSNWDGQPSTVNEVCRRFAIPRDQFMELRAIHGWTHEAEPFSKEEVLTREVEDLADDAFQQRRQALWEEFEKKKWHQTRQDAAKWNNFEQSFFQPLQEHLSTLLPALSVPMLNIRSARNPFAVVSNTGELHYGKSGWVSETGEEYSRSIAEERLVSARQEMLNEVADRGTPDCFVHAIGNDFLHVDTDKGTTTGLTPQDMDGTAAQILAEGIDLTIRDIGVLRQVAPVRIKSVPGNHDRLLTLAMLKALEYAFKNDPGVSITFSARMRAYEAYGMTLLGFCHGDSALKPKDYIATMGKEAPLLWAQTIYRAFFTGHLHSEVVRELVGGTHYQMPSLSGKDRYHERNGYLSDAAMASYVVDKQRGVVGSILTRA